VNLDTNITNSSGQTSTSPSDGSAYSQKMKSGSFSPTTVLTSANSYVYDRGNNLRFDGCTFNGPLASDVPTAYTHFGNSWEFTGATMFNNTFDTSATMVCPQTNIEMGSFTDPAKAPSTMVGVVVAATSTSAAPATSTARSSSPATARPTRPWAGSAHPTRAPTRRPRCPKAAGQDRHPL